MNANKRPHTEISLPSSLLSPQSLVGTPHNQPNQHRLQTTPSNASRYTSQSFAAMHINPPAHSLPQTTSPVRIPSAHHVTNPPTPSHFSSKAPAATTIASPLDLSSSTLVSKRLKLESPSPNGHHSAAGSPPLADAGGGGLSMARSRSSCKTPTSSGHSNVGVGGGGRMPKCPAQLDEINRWTVAQVCDFVSAIDICVEYSEVS